jgi:hypothetical protein
LKRLNFILLAGLLGGCLLAGGCAGAGSIVKAISPGKAGPKKRVLVLPLKDQAGFSPQTVEKLNSDFINRLRSSPQMVVFEPASAFKAGQSPAGSQRTGAIPLSVLQKASDMGMQAVVSVRINAVETTPRKTGIWPFRRAKKAYRAGLLLDIFDTATRTLAESSLMEDEISVRVEEDSDQDIKEIMEQLSSDIMPRLFIKQAQAAVKRLSSIPWSGRVLAVKDQHIEISGGEDVGLRQGDILDVFSRGEEIISGEGKPVYLLGRKLGLVKVESVMSDRSITSPLTGMDFSSAEIVYFRP